MDKYKLELLAFICMVIDHVGLTFYPDVVFMRVIGRIAFPVFVFFVLEGVKHTSNIKKYFMRVFVIGIVTQVIIIMLHVESITNILLPLSFLILFADYVYKKRAIKAIVILIPLLLFPGGIITLITAVVFMLAGKRLPMVWVIYSLLWFFVDVVQVAQILALFFIKIYNGKVGQKNKFLYIGYPVHLILIGFLSFL